MKFKMIKNVLVYIMGGLYIAAGAYHLISPATYMKIMPVWLPWHFALVILSGLFEILCGLLLLFVKTRQVGAFCTIALLIAVFPANIQMTVNYIHEQNPAIWVSIIRLPVQLLLIWWAYIYTKPAKAEINKKG
jgi:uncharacterized membrane protein